MKENLLSVFLLSTISLLAQNPVPNPGFESWAAGNPTSWQSSNASPLIAVTKSNDAHGGSSAAKLEVADDSGSPFPAILGVASMPVSQNHLYFSFHYKSFLNSSDVLHANVILKKAGSHVSVNNFSISLANSVYTQATYTLSYFQPVSGVADEASVEFSIGNSFQLFPSIGSYVLLDDVQLSGNLTATGIAEEQGAAVNSVVDPRPNPCSGTAWIPFTLTTKSRAVIELRCLDGKVVKKILNQEMEPGHHTADCSVEDLPAGLYLVSLNTGGKTTYSKLVVE
jgi:hypothetical protein